MKKTKKKLMDAKTRPQTGSGPLSASGSRRPAAGATKEDLRGTRSPWSPDATRLKADMSMEMAKPDRAFGNPRANAGIAASIADMKRKSRRWR